jgi:hypothetical protein
MRDALHLGAAQCGELGTPNLAFLETLESVGN